MTAVHVGDPVVVRESLVDEGVVRVDELYHVSVALKLVLEKQLGLPLEGLPNTLIEMWQHLRVWQMRRHVSHLQPLAKEVADQGTRSWVCQHSLDLLLENARLPQHAATREVEKLIVGNAAPEEKRQSGGKLHVRNPIWNARLGVRRIDLDSEQKLR